MPTDPTPTLRSYRLPFTSDRSWWTPAQLTKILYVSNPDSSHPPSWEPPVSPGPAQPTNPPYQAYPPPPPPQSPQSDRSKKFLNMSGGILALVVAGVVLLCCVGPVAVCLLGGVFNAAKPDPTVRITACDINNDGVSRLAKISYTIANNGKSTESYRVDFAVLDSSGTRVGKGSDFVFDLAGGQTARGSTVVSLDSADGVKCTVTEVD